MRTPVTSVTAHTDERSATMLRKAIIGAVVIAGFYFIITNPQGAADLVETVWNWFFDEFVQGVFDFLGALFA